MREILLEIWDSMRKSKLRTFLTGFSVAWGIFMLVILLGSGNGLKNGLMSNFNDEMRNTLTIYGGQTTLPFAGYDKNRRISLQDKDVEILSKDFSEITDISVTRDFQLKQITYKDQFQQSEVMGLTPEIIKINGMKVLEGRLVNEQDTKKMRKVVVIDENLKKTLFKNQDPMGKYVQIDSISYKVVGVYKQKRFGSQSLCYIPSITGKIIYDLNSPDVDKIIMSVKNIDTDQQSEAFEKNLKKRLAAEHHFDPQDKGALWINNSIKQFQTFAMIFKGINFFVWIIGLGTMIAGVVGVSNIMLVTVRERTFEFGIRKALGAKPRTIIFQILLESVMITALFGYIGMVLGVAVMEVVNYVIVQQAAQALASGTEDKMIMFLNPTLSLSITFSATIVLIVAGLVAGYIPARRAARIKTIDALRFNK